MSTRSKLTNVISGVVLIVVVALVVLYVISKIMA